MNIQMKKTFMIMLSALHVYSYGVDLHQAQLIQNKWKSSEDQLPLSITQDWDYSYTLKPLHVMYDRLQVEELEPVIVIHQHTFDTGITLTKTTIIKETDGSAVQKIETLITKNNSIMTAKNISIALGTLGVMAASVLAYNHSSSLFTQKQEAAPKQSISDVSSSTYDESDKIVSVDSVENNPLNPESSSNSASQGLNSDQQPTQQEDQSYSDKFTQMAIKAAPYGVGALGLLPGLKAGAALGRVLGGATVGAPAAVAGAGLGGAVIRDLSALGINATVTPGAGAIIGAVGLAKKGARLGASIGDIAGGVAGGAAGTYIGYKGTEHVINDYLSAQSSSNAQPSSNSSN